MSWVEILAVFFVSHAVGSYVGAHLPIPSPGESNEMRLYGPEGVMAVSGGPPGGVRSVHVLRPDGSSEEHRVESDNGYYNEWLNFHDALVHDEPIVGTIAQSYHNLLLVMRALDSAEEHRMVEIADVPGGLSEAGVPLWRPRGAAGLFDGLPCKIRREN